MKKIFLFFFLSISALVQGQSTLADSFVHNGIMRYYSYYVPASYQSSVQAPLVFNLHGYTSNSWQQAFYGDFRPIADTAGFIIVHPDGSIQPGTANTQFWNVGFFVSPIDDVSFIERIIDTISSRYSINASRIYSTGMSNGGYMSYELACQSNRFAAIASVTGSMTLIQRANCNPVRPVPVMQIHGTADPTVPYTGSSSSLAIDSLVKDWVQKNNCNANPQFFNIPNTVLTDGASAERYLYTGGIHNNTVELYKVINGAHTWPGASFTIGVTCMDFSASKEIWRFFNQYVLPTSLQNLASTDELKLYPNPATDQLNIETHLNDLIQVEIFQLNGQLMYQNHFTNQIQISVTDWPKGFYLARLSTEKGVQNIKWIKS